MKEVMADLEHLGTARNGLRVPEGIHLEWSSLMPVSKRFVMMCSLGLFWRLFFASIDVAYLVA